MSAAERIDVGVTDSEEEAWTYRDARVEKRKEKAENT